MRLLLVCCWLGWIAQAQAGGLELKLPRDLVWIRLGNGEGYRLLPPEQILAFPVRGPGVVGLRLCEPVLADQSVLPLDVTVVRDASEQGTVRLQLPSQAATPVADRPGWKCSRSAVVVIDVPAGRHRYELIFSGSRLGVLLQPTRSVATGEKQVVATPRGDLPRNPAKLTARRPRSRRPRRRTLVEPPLEILAGVEPSAGRIPAPHTFVMRHRQRRYGPATRTAMSVAGMGFVSALVLSASGGALLHQSRQEPVQVEAGRLLGQARRTLDAAAIVGGVAAAAALTATVMVLVGEPGRRWEDSWQVRF